MNPTGSTADTALADARQAPLGTPAPACSVNLRRVLRNKGSEVPVAAFQSSI